MISNPQPPRRLPRSASGNRGTPWHRRLTRVTALLFFALGSASSGDVRGAVDAPVLCLESTAGAGEVVAHSVEPASLHCSCQAKQQYFMNTDRRYDAAIGWSGKSFTSEVASFAEYFETPENRAGAVCHLVVAAASVSDAPDQNIEVVVWEDDNGQPGDILGTVGPFPLNRVVSWPLIEQRAYEVFEVGQVGVRGGFWAGFRGDWQSEECTVLLAVDSIDENSETPAARRVGMTYVPPGAELSEGWHPVEDIVGRPAALGIGVVIGWCPVPVKETSWGAIKREFR